MHCKSESITKTDELYSSVLFGLGEKIRTSGLLNPIQARYQTAPHPVAVSSPHIGDVEYISTNGMLCQPYFCINRLTGKEGRGDMPYFKPFCSAHMLNKYFYSYAYKYYSR